MTPQKLPTGPKREILRQKGQFWTPDWVADAMVAYVLADGVATLFDPAVGEGAFFRAAKRFEQRTGRLIQLAGTEIDSIALEQAQASGLKSDDLKDVQIQDFVLQPPDTSHPAIVANPPYIRHHRLDKGFKSSVRSFAAQLTGRYLDGRAGLHVYFLLRGLERLAPGGRLAYILPADTCEGIFSTDLWLWITQRFRLEAVVTFAPQASPFPGVDTNPLIVFIRNTAPTDHFVWALCSTATREDLHNWVQSGLNAGESVSIRAQRRSITEGLQTGLSRPPTENNTHCFKLADFARVLRGIATGANEFFFLTSAQAENLNLPAEFLIPAVGRTRDIEGDEITVSMLSKLAEQERPTLLLSPDGRPLRHFPETLQRYLRYGEELGLPQRALIASRRPWYKMETRSVPPILFAYLGRRSVRFIRNSAGVVPLTGFLCVYPFSENPILIDQLWRVLQHPHTIENLKRVGKSYGSDAIKVEPRALENLPLPSDVVKENGLEPSQRLLI